MKLENISVNIKNYREIVKLKDGTVVTIRPIRPSDFDMMVKFHEGLSAQSVYYRWFSPLGLDTRIAEARLRPSCQVDFKNEVALVAEHVIPETGEREILGEGRINREPGTNEAEIAVIICDDCQHMGLGSALMTRLKLMGQILKFDRITGIVHPENYRMQQLCRKLGFDVRYSYEDEVTTIELPLAAA